MTRDDVEFLKEFIFGASFGTILIGLLVFFVLVLGKPDSPQSGEEATRFKVVDQYKDCDVVRYTDPSNRYTYLLDCSTQ